MSPEEVHGQENQSLNWLMASADTLNWEDANSEIDADILTVKLQKGHMPVKVRVPLKVQEVLPIRHHQHFKMARLFR